MIHDGIDPADALVVGLPPIVKDWLLHNQSEAARNWRERFKLLAASRIDAANVRQKAIAEQLRRDPPRQGKHIKYRACIDPELFDDMIRRYGEGCWYDEDFLRDTEQKSPELFVPQK